ncbi:MAG: T9SS type A sorting domain-containing protein, partial [Flavobacteriales bacterium]|nr:T9SS type A sorting domain-containing protein [Flavobacteriales bacterium]
PSEGQIFISSNMDLDNLTIEIRDTKGRLIMYDLGKVINNKSPFAMDINSLASGLYILRIHNSSYMYSKLIQKL